MNFKIITSIYVLSILCNNANCQAPFFKNIDFDKEQRGTRLSKIFQDKKGYIWLGTNFGICRYNGLSFQYFENDSNEVTAIGESNTGILWAGHVNGMLSYFEDDTVKNFISVKSSPRFKITDIIFDNQNRMWVSTYGDGVYCYSGDTSFHFTTSSGLSDNGVRDLLLMYDNTIWAATDLGISICTLQNSKKNVVIINDKNGLPDDVVTSMKPDAAGNIWIALQNKGACIYKRDSNKIEIPENIKDWDYGQVYDILPLPREVLIGTETNGIIEIHFGLPSVNKMIPSKKKKIRSVKQLLLDKDDQVWLVADNLLSIANCNKFELIEIPLLWQDAIKAIATDNYGRIWFSNNSGFFTKQDNNHALEKIILPGKINYAAITSLFADTNNELWIGTHNDGLYKYNLTQNKLWHYTKADGLTDSNIFSITGNDYEIWLGTLTGATKIITVNNQSLFENFNLSKGLPNSYTYKVIIDKNDNKWFATNGSGIIKLDSSGFHSYCNIPGLEKNVVCMITQDIYGNIWFSGKNSGFFSFDGRKFKQYTIKNGLHDNEILNLISDDYGNLLLTHSNGIDIFNIKRQSFTYYGTASGFESINPQLNAVFKTKNDKILIASDDKIVKYYPTVSSSKSYPKTLINNVSIFFKPIDFKYNHTLKYNANHITFDYAGLWYFCPESVKYQYMLEGYSQEWISTRDHVVTFPNLPPGEYVFKVRSSLNNNYEFASTATWRFEIEKPFWQTIWFLFLSVLIIGFTIFYFLALKIRLMKYAQENEKQNLLIKLALLKNQLNPHFLFNSFNTLMNIIDKDKKKALSFAEKLSDFYREILLIQDKEKVTVEEEIALLKNYVYLQQSRFDNKINLQINIADEHQKKFLPPMTLQLLAENAIKHNSIHEKTLVIKIDSAQFFLIVSNNISNRKKTVRSTGIGLKNIGQRIKMLTGREMQIIQTETEFNVIVPL